MTDHDFSTLQVVEVKAELLKKRGLPVCGLKRELVERLVAATSQEEAGGEEDGNMSGEGDEDENGDGDENEDEEAKNEERSEEASKSTRTRGGNRGLSSQPVSLPTRKSKAASKSASTAHQPQAPSPFLILAPELLTSILSHITRPSHLASLSLVSTQTYARVIPFLYAKFTYHGIHHDQKNLKRFWLTVMWKPELAACVKELDVGEWGKCPKVEDWVGMYHDGRWDGPPEEEPGYLEGGGEGQGAREGDEEGDEDEMEGEVNVEEVEDGGGDGDEDVPWDDGEESVATVEYGGIDQSTSSHGNNEESNGNYEEKDGGEGDNDEIDNHDEETARLNHEKTRAKWQRKKEEAEYEALMSRPMPPYFKISKSDDEDDDFEPSQSGSDSVNLASGDESDMELESGGYLGPVEKNERYEDAYEALRAENSMLGFPYEDFLTDFYKASWDPEEEPDDEDVLCELLPLLKNLKTVYMMPIDPEWYGFPLRKMVKESCEDGGTPVLEKLESLFMCSSLHLGSKDHREYEMDLYQFLPYLLLPNLRTLAVLTPITPYENHENPGPDFTPYTNKSNITSLTIDECQLQTRDTISLIAVPKALTYLRWSQNSSCNSGTLGCQATFHKRIVPALLKHKASLQELDLDLRHTRCGTRGHPANPETTDEGLREYYGQETTLRAADRGGLLLGSLRHFEALKSLSIDVDALCGHQRWVESPSPMVELLPINLHTLILRVKAKPGPELALGFENEIWMKQAVDMVRRKEGFVAGLKVFNVKVAFDSGDRGEGKCVGNEKGERELWRELEETCLMADVEFGVQDEEWGTRIPYFVEKKGMRNPGRDW